MLHGEGTLKLSRAQHSGHLADVITDAIIGHLLLAEKCRVFLTLRLYLCLDPFYLLFDLVAGACTTLSCASLGLCLCMTQLFLHLLGLLIEVPKRTLRISQLGISLLAVSLRGSKLVLEKF